jgi:hypothetical protein
MSIFEERLRRRQRLRTRRNRCQRWGFIQRLVW